MNNYLFSLLTVTILLTSCQSNTSPASEEEGATTPDSLAIVPVKPWNESDGLYALIYTAKGRIVCSLAYDKTPITCANFVGLAEGTIANSFRKKLVPYYDGLTFHRVETDFVIQGGDPQGNGMGGPGYTFKNEYDPELRHDRKGVLAMANAGPNTNGSQFYLSLKALPMLDGGNYTVFGKTVEGDSVLSLIVRGDVMDSIRIVRIGEAADSFRAEEVFQLYQIEQQEDAKRAELAAKEALKAWDQRVKEKYPNAKRTSSGLYYIEVKKGAGKPARAGAEVSVHYTGTLWNGMKFDSSLDRGEPITFKLGEGNVIKGWDEGIALMKTGSKFKLLIPAVLGYGAQGTPGGPIPPNADLIFDTELVSTK